MLSELVVITDVRIVCCDSGAAGFPGPLAMPRAETELLLGQRTKQNLNLRPDIIMVMGPAGTVMATSCHRQNRCSLVVVVVVLVVLAAVSQQQPQQQQPQQQQQQ